ncbi:MAG TPA: addiction module protein [bacterium]|nr:addiction module protein [bacterium]
MGTTAKKIMAEAMGLPPELRAFVAQKLIESLDASAAPPLSAQWKKEVQRRCAEMDRGAAKLRSADAVFVKAYASLT